MKQFSVWIGYDPREIDAFLVAKHSVEINAEGISVHGLVLDRLRRAGLYWRPTEKRDGQLWDVISDAPMSTEFSISRFLVPSLARGRWALFMDSDMLVRGDLSQLFLDIYRDHADKAVVCVKHNHQPTNSVKMDGQIQTQYSKKNWSSFCAFNLDHPANAALTVDLVNTVPGRDLHNFCWLEDDALIGEIPLSWNWLVGYSDPKIEPLNVHWTAGVPSMPGYEDAPYAHEYREALHDFVEGQPNW